MYSTINGAAVTKRLGVFVAQRFREKFVRVVSQTISGAARAAHVQRNRFRLSFFNDFFQSRLNFSVRED